MEKTKQETGQVQEVHKGHPLVVVLLTTFIDLVGFGILIPIIPLLLTDPRSEFFLLPQGYSIADGLIIFGFLTAAFPLAQFFATPILGQLSDKYGRKKILAISLAGTCLSYLIFALGIITKNIPLLFASRIFDGITGGNISVAQAVIADVTAPKDRAKNFGLIGAAFGLGFILGPYLGGRLSDPTVVSWFSATTPFYFAAILSAINIVMLMFFLPETNKHQVKDMAINVFKSVNNVIEGFKSKSLRGILSVSFLFNAGFTFFTAFAGVFLIHKFGFKQNNIGDFFAYVGLWIAFTQAVVTRQATRCFKEHQILKVTLIATGLGIFLYTIPSVWWGLLIAMPFFALPVGLTMASTMGMVSKAASMKEQGKVLGIGMSVQALAQSIPPIIGGYVGATIDPNAPIYISAAVILVSGIVYLVMFRKYEEPEYAHNMVSNEAPELVGI